MNVSRLDFELGNFRGLEGAQALKWLGPSFLEQGDDK
jgi:hypothetical protein